MAILMGLLTALAWGITDFLIGLNARTVGILRSLAISNAVSLVLLLPLYLFWAPKLPADQGTYINLLAILSSVLVVAGALLLSKAFQIGKISLIAPLVTTYGCFTTLFAALAGDVLSAVQYVAIGLCCLGVMLNSRTPANASVAVKRDTALPVVCALASAAAWGLSFWIQGKYVLKVYSPVHMLLLNSLIGFVTAAGMARIALQTRQRLSNSARLYLCGAACANLAGFLFFTTGLSLGSPAVTTVLSTCSGAIASTIAICLLKEKASAVQIVGGLVIVSGAMLLIVTH